MNSLKSLAMNCGPLSEDPGPRLRMQFRCALQDDLDVRLSHRLPQISVDDVAAAAVHYAETGEPNQAIEAYRDLRVRITKSNPDLQNDLLNAAQISRLDGALPVLLRRVGRPDEAGSLDQNRLGLWRLWDRKLPNNPFVQRQIARK